MNRVKATYISIATRLIDYNLYLRRNKLGKWWTKRDRDWAEENWNSRNHPHRAYLIEKIATFSPLSNVLEIGCATGVNLYLLAKRFPDTEIRGIDINPHAVDMGNKGLSRKEITNVKLSIGRTENLSQFKDKSFDVVFTDAVLIYIQPKDIKIVLKEMIRIARKGLILIERHASGSDTYTKGCWVRDYVTPLKQYTPKEQIEVTKITKDIWDDEGWGKNGYLIEARLEENQ